MLLKIIQHDSPDYTGMIRLRMDVLLSPIGIPESYINKQKEAEYILIGAFEEDKLVGCCILSEKNKETVQLRQMAVLKDLQGKGIGRLILEYAEDVARQRGYKVLMMHARDAVLDFYKKCHYRIAGEQFTEVDIPHHAMEKDL